jgi:flagellar hook-basal body complex protein FliE
VLFHLISTPAVCKASARLLPVTRGRRDAEGIKVMDPISMVSLLAKLQEARAVVSGLPAAPSAPVASPKQVDFASMLKGSLDRVDQAQGTANKMAEQFQKGDPKVTLEDTMVAVQKANISFQSALQIRNRVVTAYHDIMNLQI